MNERNITMNDDLILFYVRKFRQYIESALNEGLLDYDFLFNHFPRACCGDTCYLLAEYLRGKGIETLYVCGDYNGQSHAWLVVKDERIKPPEPTRSFRFEMPDDVINALYEYGGNIDFYEKELDTFAYTANCLKDGLILDITADQFGEEEVYVGYINDFYKKFEFMEAHICNGIDGSFNNRLLDLYQIIISQSK